MVRIITSRPEIAKVLRKAQNTKVLAPFGIKSEYFDGGKIITRQGSEPIYGKRRQNAKLHAKLMLTRDEAIIGSCNFTQNSVQRQHEIVAVIPRTAHPVAYEALDRFFSKIWRGSTEFSGINDTI